MFAMTPRPDERLRIVGDPLFRVVGDEVFILMPDSRVHWLKNATAGRVWERLRASGCDGITAHELAAALVREFEVELERALSDVLAFIGELADRGLVASV